MSLQEVTHSLTIVGKICSYHEMQPFYLNSKIKTENIVQITIDLFYFREIDHPNVLKLLGQCTEAPPLLAIVEYASLVSFFCIKIFNIRIYIPFK